MPEEPKVGRSAYWAAYRELVKQVWNGWWKKTAYAMFAIAVGCAVLHFVLKKPISARLEVYVAFTLIPALVFLLGSVVLSFARAPFKMAKAIEEDRDRLKEQVAVQDEQPQVLRAEGLKFQQWLKDANRNANGLRQLLDAAADLLDSTLGEPEGDRLFEYLGERRDSDRLYLRNGYDGLGREARDYLLSMSSDATAMPVSSTPDRTAVLATVESTMKAAVSECVETMNRFGGSAPERETEPRCRALDDFVELVFLGEKRQLYRERGKETDTDARGLSTRYDLLRSHFIDSLTAEEINPHCGVSNWNEWMAKYKAEKLPPSNQKRLQVAKKLIRDASLEFRKEVVEANASRETAMEYFKSIHQLVTLVAKQRPDLQNYFKIDHGHSHWHRMGSQGGHCCEIYAANLANVGVQLKLPSKDGVLPFLRAEFMPKEENAGWRDYL